MRTLNADQLKAVLSMEGSLGHIHTLADVENTIDFLAKEEPEAASGVENSIFSIPRGLENPSSIPAVVREYANELIFSLRTDSGFRLKDVTDETQLKAKFWSGLRGLQLRQFHPRKENFILRASTSCWVRILR